MGADNIQRAGRISAWRFGVGGHFPGRRGTSSLGAYLGLLFLCSVLLGMLLLPLNEAIKVEKFFNQAVLVPAELDSQTSRLTGGSPRDLSGVEGIYLLKVQLPDSERVSGDSERVTIRLDSAEYLFTDPDFSTLAVSPTAPDQAWLAESFVQRLYGRIGVALIAAVLLCFCARLLFMRGWTDAWQKGIAIAVLAFVGWHCLDFSSLAPEADIFEQVRVGDLAGLQQSAKQSHAERNIVGDSPLHLAAYQGNSEVVSVLLKHKARVDLRNDDGITPLMLAVRRGHLETSRLLLEAGANPDYINFSGTSAIGYAYRHQDQEMVDLLLAHGSDISGGSWVYPNYEANLRAFIHRTGRDDLRVVLSRTDQLVKAVKHNDIDAARSLLIAKASPNTRVGGYRSLVYRAAMAGNEDMFDLLMRYGGIIDYPILTVLHQDENSIRYAAKQGGNQHIIDEVYKALPDLTHCEEFHRRFKNQATHGDLFCPRKVHLDLPAEH